MKKFAYVLIAFGIIVSIGFLYLIFNLLGWTELILGWLFLGLLPIISGIVIIKKLKSQPNLTLGKK